MCPPGHFGSSEGLKTAECTGLCLPGEYCPEGSVQPTICPKGYYCSQGHIRYKRVTLNEFGSNSVVESSNLYSFLDRSPCPAGRYGGRIGIEDHACSGLCRAGFYCPDGSSSKHEVQCPAGRFGAIAGLPDDSCSGPCLQGFYCPAGSTDEKAFPCGGTGVYCPVGSPKPVGVSPGYYSVGSTVPDDKNTRSHQLKCEPGFYCTLTEYPQPGGFHSDVAGGTRHPCPPGSYGAVAGLVSTTKPRDGHEYDAATDSDFICSGLCERGFYCPLNSTSSRQVPCPAGRYGATAGLVDDRCTAMCPMGHYCPLGAYEPIPCPAGIVLIYSLIIQTLD